MIDALANITLDDLNEDNRELAETIGIDNYKALVERFGGTAIYVPQQAAFERSVRNEQIRREFNGYNYNDLAKKYGLTAASIRYIVNDITKRRKSGVCKDQISIFDYPELQS